VFGKVVVSPSLTEGVDFKYDKCRAQIILKHPIPNIGAAYINNRRKGNPELGILPDKNFISHVTYTTLTQQYGRVMRSEDDWGFTFVFDNKSAHDIRSILEHPRLINEMNASFLFEGVRNNFKLF
jgi:Rad3-related DNA helicase